MVLQKRVVISAGVFVAVLLLLFGSLFVFESRSVPQVDNVATSIKGAVANPDAVANTPLTTGQSKVTFTQVAKRYWVIAAVSVVAVLAVIFSAVVLAVYLRNEEVGVTTPVPVPGDDPVKTDTDDLDVKGYGEIPEWVYYLLCGSVALMIMGWLSVSFYNGRSESRKSTYNWDRSKYMDTRQDSHQHSIKILLYNWHDEPINAIELFSTTPPTIFNALEVANLSWPPEEKNALWVWSPGLKSRTNDTLFQVGLQHKLRKYIDANEAYIRQPESFPMTETTQNAILTTWLYQNIRIRASNEGNVLKRFEITRITPNNALENTQIMRIGKALWYSPTTPLSLAQVYRFCPSYTMYYVKLTEERYEVREVSEEAQNDGRYIEEYQKQLASMVVD